MTTKTPAKKPQSSLESRREKRVLASSPTSRRKSGTSSATQRKTRSTFGADLIEALEQVVEHQRGKIELEQVWPKPVDVKAIRRQTKLSQAEFSRVYGISKRALQEWEQGGRQPDQTARAYLAVIAKEPALVRRALAKES